MKQIEKKETILPSDASLPGSAGAIMTEKKQSSSRKDFFNDGTCVNLSEDTQDERKRLVAEGVHVSEPRRHRQQSKLKTGDYLEGLEEERKVKWLTKCWKRRKNKRLNKQLKNEQDREKKQEVKEKDCKIIIEGKKAFAVVSEMFGMIVGRIMTEYCLGDFSQQVYQEWKWVVPKSRINWKALMIVATWNVRTMLAMETTQLICSDLHTNNVAMAAIQECRWEGKEVAKKMHGYVWYGGGAWKNTTGGRVGGAVVAIHSSLAKSVRKQEHRGGRVQLVQLEGRLGRNITFASFYYPTETSPQAEKDKFWKDVEDALNSIGHK
jgi:hypothetical protein